jgi:hypothetical protein
VPPVCQDVAVPQREPPHRPARFPAQVPQAKGSAPANAIVAPYRSDCAFTAIISVSHHDFIRPSSPRE